VLWKPHDILGGVKWVFRIAGLFCLATVSFGQGTGLIGILSQELDRNFKALREKADPPP
jgi:hypothetical protein